MPCPDCGGRDRVTLDPGVFECTSPRVVGGVPSNLVSYYGPATTLPISGPCGHRYTAAEERQADEKVRADAARKALEERRKEDQFAAARAEWRVALDEWMTGFNDPIEREIQLVRIGRRFTPIPGLGPWFVERAARASVTPDTVRRQRKTIFGNVKIYSDRAYYFPNGSLLEVYWEGERVLAPPGHLLDGSEPRRPSTTWGVGLSLAGEWLQPPNYNPGPGGYGEIVVEDMARMLRMPNPPLHPMARK